jgi:hypothetical protein
MAFLDRCPGWVVLSTPTAWFQEDHPVPTERHRSLWTVGDFCGNPRTHECFETAGGLFITLKPKGA